MNFKKILLAVDASDNARRAVEYTGSVAGSSPGFSVEVLCIERLPHRDLFPDEKAWEVACTEARTELQSFLLEARRMLIEAGVPEQDATTHYVSTCDSPFEGKTTRCSLGTSVAQEILDILKEGGFGTVVVGRRGVSKAEEFLFGSVSNKIIHSAKNCTVWVVA